MAKKNRPVRTTPDEEIEVTKEDGEKVTVGQVYIFKSLNAMRLNIRPSKSEFSKVGYNTAKKVVVEGPIYIEFPKETRMFVLNEQVAAEHGLSIDEMLELIRKQSGYGRTFVAILGPGIKVTDETRNFEKRVDTTIPTSVKVEAGIRSAGGTGGR